MSNPNIMYAAPVKRGQFACDRELKVNNFPRCSSEKLYELLTWQDKGPVLTKSGKPRVHQPPPHRDETAAFYEAQCIHYGLQGAKTKPAAKKRLLAAWNASQGFVVPQSVRDIEKELRAEYEVANEAARKQSQLAKQRREEEYRQNQLKRKREDEDLANKVQAASKKAGSGAKKAAGGAKKARKQDAFNIRDICASFQVSCPYIQENYGSDSDDSFFLDLAPISSNTIYGEFYFGAWEGYLRSIKIDSASRTITFHWRGRETGEGESTFDESNLMKIKFVDDRHFEGTVQGDYFGSCKIVGVSEDDGSQAEDFESNAESWKYEYEELNEDNYERERVNRWR